MAGSRQAGAGRGLTLVQVDIVLPLLLVSRAVVSGALEDVSPVPDVMPDGHLLQPAVRVAHGPPGLPDLGEVLLDTACSELLLGLLAPLLWS